MQTAIHLIVETQSAESMRQWMFRCARTDNSLRLARSVMILKGAGPADARARAKSGDWYRKHNLRS